MYANGREKRPMQRHPPTLSEALAIVLMNIPENNTRRCYKMNNLFLHFFQKHLPIGWVIITIDVPVVGLYKLLKET
jgi:hypothetical protein